ncbi:MAG: hypothetical protein WCQ99_08725 [Pseudomonadota bacterium]
MPPNNKSDFNDCFTVEGNLHIFWFLTADKSTHVLIYVMNASSPSVDEVWVRRGDFQESHCVPYM